jgi:bifunctional DNase/RNase
MKKRFDVQLSSAEDYMELEPYGVTAAADNSRPVMLFKSIETGDVLPVWLSAIDAGVALSQHQVAAPDSSPHDLTIKVMDSLGVRLDRCVFTEIRGHHQYVELFFSGSRKLRSIVARADQAMSFSLQAKTRFFCTRQYVNDSKILSAEMNGMMKDLKLKPGVARNRHPYLN